ncbi:glycosyltransferase family 2 protein, partial [Pseudomonas sp. GW531-E2]
MRELFSRRPQPYYIYVSEYRRSSAGIRVLHMLCDALNRSGQEAYIVTVQGQPELVTPFLSDDIKRRHEALGLEPIAVYPEVIDGNPLNANIVVRYLLNQPGFIRTTADFGDNDIFYAYTRDLVQPGMPADRVMFLPAFDLSVFRPSDDPSKRVAGKVCYYLGRSQQATIDPSLLPADAVEITPHWPDSWEALSVLFQQCEYFYCGESSGLAAEAVLCGCLAVVLPSRWAPNKIAQHESKSHGVAWSLEPDELERARSTIGMLRERLLMQQREFWEALDRFIETTQAAARMLLATAPARSLPAWLQGRHSMAQRRLASTDASLRPATATLDIRVLADGAVGSAALARTLQSLEGCPLDTLQVTVLAPSQVVPGVEHVFWDGNQTASVVNALVQRSTARWQLIVRAGVVFSHDALLVIGRELAVLPDECVALYADEVSRAADGSLGEVLRPDLNLDLLLGDPGGLGGHWLLRQDALLQLGGFDGAYGQAFELDYQLRLIEHFGLGCVAHVATPLLVKDLAQRQACPHEQAAIARHLNARGYDLGKVTTLPSGRYRIAYGQASQASVSILIPLRGTLTQFQRCITSLLERTRHEVLEVLLIAPTDLDEEVHAWLAAVEQIAGGLLRVLSFKAGLPWVYLCNQAAQQASGEYLVWLEGATTELGQDWLGLLLEHARRPEVGAVGGKLLTPAGDIFSAGMVLGLEGV